FQRLAALELAQDALEHRAEHLGGDGVKDCAHRRIARAPLNAIDGRQIPLCTLFVIGEQRRRFEGQQGKRRHERIASGNLHLERALFWNRGKAVANQAKERIGGQMLTYLRRQDGHGIPRHENLKSFKSGGIFASRFTKGQGSSHSDHWARRLSGNWWPQCIPRSRAFFTIWGWPIRKLLLPLPGRGVRICSSMKCIWPICVILTSMPNCGPAVRTPNA